MSHAIHRIERFDIVGPYTLRLDFADGSRREIDFRSVLEGQVLGALRDVELFNAVQLDAMTGVLQWPNGADFDPETLRNWPSYKDDFVAMTRRWSSATDC